MQPDVKKRFYWLPLIMFLVGIVLTMGGTFYVVKMDERVVHSALSERAPGIFQSVHERMQRYQSGLDSISAAILAAGPEQITRERFARFGRSFDLNGRYIGAKGLGFVRRVPDSIVESFVKRMQREHPGFRVIEFEQDHAHTGDHFIVQYLEPEDSNNITIGLDIASEFHRQEAAIESMRMGKTRLTAPLNLLNEQSGRHSFLLLQPIYREGAIPDTVEKRVEAGVGWANIPVNMDDVLADNQRYLQDLILEMRDVTEQYHPAPFFRSGDGEIVDVFKQRIEIYGRTWEMSLAATSAFASRLPLIPIWLVVCLGFVFSVLLALLVRMLLFSRSSHQKLMMERTKMATLVECSVDAIIGKTTEGRVISWNGGAERIFGYTREEAVGELLVDLLIPERLAHEEDEFLARIKSGKMIVGYETIRHRKDGTELPVSVSVAPVRDPAGKVVGASKIVRDISQQKAAEAQVRELNNNLEKQVQQRTKELSKINTLTQSVLNSASEFCIIATDTEGVITVFNRGAEMLLGYSAEEMVGKCSPAVFHVPEEMEARGNELSADLGYPVKGFEVFIAGVSEGRQSMAQEWTYVCRDGNRPRIKLVVSAMCDETGTIIGYLGIGMDITATKLSEQKLARAREELLSTTHTLLVASKTAGLGIWKWELDSNQLIWNDKMFELYDQPITDNMQVSYNDWRERIHPDDIESVERQLQDSVDGRGNYDPVFRIVSPSGELRYVQAGAHVEHNDSGEATRVTGINWDVTEDRALRDSLITAKERADAASAAKSLFLANMSHEIRTPMNAVLGMLQLLQKTHLDKRQSDYTVKARIAATSLLGLLNDILDYSKLDAEKMEIDAHTFDLNVLFEDLAVVLAGNLQDKPVELLFDYDETLPRYLIGDRLRIQQVLINLASNAIKFTDKGEVVIRVGDIHRTEDRIELEIAVSDTGIGISSEQRERIFEGFTQAEASTSRRYGGTGLGLVISRRLVQLMGGDLTLKSKVGKGSTFSFSLYLEIDPQSREAEVPKLADGTEVILIEPNHRAMEIIGGTLKRLGAQVLGTSTVAEAIGQVAGKASASDERTLLLGTMPDASELEKLSALEGHNQIAMLCPAGYDSEAGESDPRIAEVCSKTLTPLQLVRLIDGLHTSVDEVLVRTDSVSTDEQSVPLAGLKLLLVEDNEFNQLVASELLEGEGAEVVVADGGLEGVNKVICGGEFDLVLMDMQMPDIDGLEATRRIRAHGGFEQLPIVAMTANVSQEDRQACLDSGMNDHLGKPLELDQLVATILKFTRPGQATPQNLPVLGSVKSALARFGGNRTLYRRMLESFLPSFAPLCRKLEQQIAERKTADIKATLHTMKGMAGTTGLDLLCKRLQERELQLVDNQLELTPQLVEELDQLARTEYQRLRADPLLQTDDTIPAQQGDISNEDIETAIELMQQGNLEALDIVARIQAGLNGRSELANVLKALNESSENLDFDEGIKQLRALQKRLS